tara:strand:+ start:292 stop:462 length:171 start_codon:yes stop_codon:yes gene_type:complete
MTYHSKEDLISVKQYSETRNIKPVTVYKMISRGKLPTIKIGGQIYIYKNRIPQFDE